MKKGEVDYISELNKIKKEKRDVSVKKFKGGYKKGVKESKEEITPLNLFERATEKYKFPLNDEQIGYFTAIAKNLMKHGSDKGDTYSALQGAQIYETLNRGDRESVKQRLLKAIKNSPDTSNFEEIKEFYQRNKKIGFEI